MAGSPVVSPSLTSDQAALLLLVLQQVTKHHTSKGATQNATDINLSSPMEFSPPANGSVGYNTSTSSYDSTSDSLNSSFEGIGYNLPELLRRKKNTKSSEALCRSACMVLWSLDYTMFHIGVYKLPTASHCKKFSTEEALWHIDESNSPPA